MLKKEHLLHYMLKGHVHLSKKDYGFFNNLQFIIRDRQQITSNQNKLFDKLILKYQRQLKKLGYELDVIQKLEWDVQLIQTIEEYLHARISIEDGELFLRTPFNAKFLSAFRSEENNTFEWDKDFKMYRSKFYTHSLRLAIDNCKKYFNTIDYCDQIKALIEPLKIYEDVSMKPTMVKENGKYCIRNSNKSLDVAIQGIELNNDPLTLFELSKYGIFTSDEILNNDPFLIFASSFRAKLDIDVLLKNPEYFTRLGIKNIYYPVRQRVAHDKEMVEFCNNNGIKLHGRLETIEDNAVYIRRASYGLFQKVVTPKLDKIIELVNSRPIDVK